MQKKPATRMNEQVILVDKNDKEIGTEEKTKAHVDGKLHRAFSIFIFNNSGKMLLQKRASDKYHSGGLWTNACCSHPRPKENLAEATHRRLKEEMGFDCPLKTRFRFIYKAALNNGITEHELDYVFTGLYEGEIKINPDEADDYKWIDIKSLKEDLACHPNDYTAWFKIAVDVLLNSISK
jgi:isopentenyl-diphosphate delta-isomerase